MQELPQGLQASEGGVIPLLKSYLLRLRRIVVDKAFRTVGSAGYKKPATPEAESRVSSDTTTFEPLSGPTLLACVCLLFFLMAGVVPADETAIKALMRKLDKSMMMLEDSLDIGDLEESNTNAQELCHSCLVLCTGVPEGVPKAKEGDFKKLREGFYSSILRLMSSTQNSTLNIARSDYKQVRQFCKDCHSQFKN